jgi:predicted N-acyltransferase
VELRLATAIADISPRQWDALSAGHPFLRHAFLHALEASGCVSEASGWKPRHLTLWRGETMVAAMPLYEKTHSFGEFVFDWAWAEAYQRAGLAYYPKLLAAIPFTPVPGSRLLAQDDAIRHALVDAALRQARDSGVSSMHFLFQNDAQTALLASRGLMIRRGVQFHWHNRGFRDFGDFLDTLTRDKRKKIRQDRRRVADAGVTLLRLPGRSLERHHWAFFFRCYCQTFHERGHTPYLNLDFFLRIGESMPDQVLLILALRGDTPVAAALDIVDEHRLYGRYWGALEFVSGLHYEACYYQGIEYCIERKLDVFEGGAQGEHKLARGFDPVATASAHWLRDPRFATAVERFLEREAQGIDSYLDELNEHTPFR